MGLVGTPNPNFTLGLEQPTRKPKLKSIKNGHSTSFMGGERRGSNYIHTSTSHLLCEDLILKIKDKRRRSEPNDGEAYSLVNWGKPRALLRERLPSSFYPFFVLDVQSWHLIRMSA